MYPLLPVQCLLWLLMRHEALLVAIICAGARPQEQCSENPCVACSHFVALFELLLLVLKLQMTTVISKVCQADLVATSNAMAKNRTRHLPQPKVSFAQDNRHVQTKECKNGNHAIETEVTLYIACEAFMPIFTGFRTMAWVGL